MNCKLGCRVVPALMLAVFIWNLAGCVAAAGIGGDVAGALAERSVDAFGVGKTKSFQVARLDAAVDATRRTATEMDLRLLKEKKLKDGMKLVYVDQTKQKITITLHRRTSTVTEMKSDVGLFGEWGLGRLTMLRMLHELPGGTAEEKRVME